MLPTHPTHSPPHLSSPRRPSFPLTPLSCWVQSLSSQHARADISFSREPLLASGSPVVNRTSKGQHEGRSRGAESRGREGKGREGRGRGGVGERRGERGGGAGNYTETGTDVRMVRMQCVCVCVCVLFIRFCLLPSIIFVKICPVFFFVLFGGGCSGVRQGGGEGGGGRKREDLREVWVISYRCGFLKGEGMGWGFVSFGFVYLLALFSFFRAYFFCFYCFCCVLLRYGY